MKRRVSALFALGLGLAAGEAAACSCAHTAIEERIDAARTIALVRVRRVELDPTWQAGDNGFANGYPLQAEADVLETLRGVPRTSLRLRSGFGDGDCGVPLVPGHDVLLVEAADGETFDLDFCSASRLLGLGSLLAAAGRPVPPSLDRLFVQALRDYLAMRTPIHTCLRGGVPPPPPPPDADPSEAEPDCRALLRAAPDAAR